jgi:3-hydroxyisobutyrate dehydrogenase-like beta-hydroxyacid dehydrogenase
MKIGVIGIGPVGGTIARKLVAHGHAVHVATCELREKVRGAQDDEPSRRRRAARWLR